MVMAALSPAEWTCRNRLKATRGHLDVYGGDGFRTSSAGCVVWIIHKSWRNKHQYLLIDWKSCAWRPVVQLRHWFAAVQQAGPYCSRPVLSLSFLSMTQTIIKAIKEKQAMARPYVAAVRHIAASGRRFVLVPLPWAAVCWRSL